MDSTQRQMARALIAGQRLAKRSLQWRDGLTPGPETDVAGAELGALLGDPSRFWATAATLGAGGDGATVGALALSLDVASAQLAAGNLDFVRAGLLGQAQWLSVLTLTLARKAEDLDGAEALLAVRLALQAQRQAAQTLASAAALDRLGVSVDQSSDG